MHDDDLTTFESQGALALPESLVEGHVEHDGARIWYATCGDGAPVILLHGGLGHSGNWGYQVPALVEAGYRVILIDGRGHGRSTRDSQPYSYDQMASDVLAVLDALELVHAVFVGWSDGACTALILASWKPDRVSGVFFFACNMDPSGVIAMDEPSPVVMRCFSRHAEDYARLSATPDDFRAFVDAVSLMQETQPNFTAQDLTGIRIPVAIVQSEHDEFIKHEHAEYLAGTIPNAELIILPSVTHFAPLQRPEEFNAAVLDFLGNVQA